jgi:dihydrofolate synthase / folylpolyglutamate synthase
MNLFDWLSYLETLPSGLANKSLIPLTQVARRLNVLAFGGKVITVAGSNGKGATVVFLESMLLAAGFKVCSFISPHLLNYQERIRLNGKNVDDDILCQALGLVEGAKMNETLSYFEFTTLAALVIFKNENPDFYILETGLGGRFDAVNIVDCDLAIITTIALEHTSILGNTKEAIGYEKAGIIRPNKPVVCGENMPQTVINQALGLSAKLWCLGKDFSYVETGRDWNWSCDRMVYENLPEVSLPKSCAALAIMAVNLILDQREISIAHIIYGLKKAYLPGRFERRVFNGKRIIFDVAHNAEATTLLVQNLLRDKGDGRLLAVTCMLKDKDIVASFFPLKDLVDFWFLGILKSSRSADAGRLLEAMKENGIDNFQLFPLVQESFKIALAECQEKDKIVVFGSFYIVAEILKTLEEENNNESGK